MSYARARKLYELDLRARVRLAPLERRFLHRVLRRSTAAIASGLGDAINGVILAGLYEVTWRHFISTVPNPTVICIYQLGQAVAVAEADAVLFTRPETDLGSQVQEIVSAALRPWFSEFPFSGGTFTVVRDPREIEDMEGINGTVLLAQFCGTCDGGQAILNLVVPYAGIPSLVRTLSAPLHPSPMGAHNTQWNLEVRTPVLLGLNLKSLLSGVPVPLPNWKPDEMMIAYEDQSVRAKIFYDRGGRLWAKFMERLPGLQRGLPYVRLGRAKIDRAVAIEPGRFVELFESLQDDFHLVCADGSLIPVEIGAREQFLLRKGWDARRPFMGSTQ